PNSHRAHPPRHARRPTLHRYRRVLALLLTLFATELMWRTGAFAHPSTHLEASPAAARHARASHHRARSAAHTRIGSAGPAIPSPAPEPVGSPLAVSQGARTELDRLISLGYPVCRGAGTKPLVALTFDDGPGPYTQ